MRLYSADFEVTGGDLMEWFVSLEVEQSAEGIALHLDTYIQELIEECRLIHKKFIKPKKVPMQQGHVLKKEDFPAIPDPFKQSLYRSVVAKIQLAAHWVRFDISFPATQLARFFCIGRSFAPGSTHASDRVPDPPTQPQA